MPSSAAEIYFGHSPPVPSRPNPTAGPLDPLSGNPRRETSGKVPAERSTSPGGYPPAAAGIRRTRSRLQILGHGQTSRLHKQLIRRTEHAESAGARRWA